MKNVERALARLLARFCFRKMVTKKFTKIRKKISLAKTRTLRFSQPCAIVHLLSEQTTERPTDRPTNPTNEQPTDPTAQTTKDLG